MSTDKTVPIVGSSGNPDSPTSLEALIALPPLTTPPIPYVQFLQELHDHPERSDSAPALLLRAIKEAGMEEPEKETDPERRLYLQMLRDMGIPSYKAFYHAAGTQRFARRLLAFLSSAGSVGAQLYKMIVIEGGAGSGKDFFLDGIAAVVEKYARVYAVKGCNFHENPLNLLKLVQKFAPEKMPLIATAIGVEISQLEAMLSICGEPCRDCYNRVMGTLEEGKQTPSLECIEVETIRLNERGAGVSQWKPGGDLSLARAMQQANRGFLSMPDAFLKREPKAGDSDERLLLLDAVQYRRLPGGPFDALVATSTNKNAYEEFLKTLPDPNAFTSRTDKLNLPYGTVRIEEVRAYRSALAQFKVQATFDPLVLHILATVAVLSRQAEPPKSAEFIHPVAKLRLYQGEALRVKLLPASQWEDIWGTGGSSTASSATTAGALSKDVPITASALWDAAGQDEGKVGLDMRFMLSLLSTLNMLGVEGARKAKLRKTQKQQDAETDPVVITTLTVLKLLREIVNNKSKDLNLTSDEKKVFNRVLKWLGGPPTPMPPSQDKPELIEREYRRLLKGQLLQVFSPDYETRAQQLYEDYKLHATALHVGEAKVKDPKLGWIEVNEALVDELDRYRLGKSLTAPLSNDDKKFRGGLEVFLSDARDEFIAERGQERAKEFKETWETIPELEHAIRAKLDFEVGKVVNTILSTEVPSDLEEKDQKTLAEAIAKLESLGYTKDCQKPILEYAKRVKVWSHQD